MKTLLAFALPVAAESKGDGPSGLLNQTTLEL